MRGIVDAMAERKQSWTVLSSLRRWKRVASMPVPMSEHCSVGLDKEVMVIGGEGREDRVLKLRLKDRK